MKSIFVFLMVPISPMIFMLKYTFIAHTFLGCRKCWIERLFDHQPDKLLPLTLYRICVAAHVSIKVHKDDVMNDAVFVPLSNCR